MDTEQRKLIEALYLEMYEKLLSYACCSLEEEALAEEAVQEAFRIACQKAGDLQASPSPQGWMFNAVKNTIRNIKHVRANASRIFLQYLMVREDTCLEDAHSLETLYGSLAQTEDFKLLKEYVLDKKSHYELAQARGITVAACKKRLQRAKENLRQKILE